MRRFQPVKTQEDLINEGGRRHYEKIALLQLQIIYQFLGI